MKILEYHQFAPHIRAFSTERGIDDAAAYTEPYLGFNINPYCGDSASHIDACRAELAQLIDVPSNDILLPHQVHGVTVANLDNGDTTEGADALMTTRSRLCIGVSTADCIPVLLYDAEHCAVAAVHAGWRGTVKRIVQKAVAAMTAAYATRPEALKAVIGPGISMKNFEVGDEVYEEFRSAGFPMETMARRYPTKLDSTVEKWHLDIVECNSLQLLDAGLTPQSIHVEAVCTYDNNDQFFSARREQVGTVKCGRNFNAIIIKNND